MRWPCEVLFVILIPYVSSYDYDESPVEDPLKPVWSRLDSISKDILSGFQNQFQNFLQNTSEEIDTKFNNLKSQLGDVSGSSQSPSTQTMIGQVTDQVTEWFETFYKDTIRKENDEAIKVAERGIRVRIDALENKLIEHINLKFESLKGGEVATATNTSVSVPAGSQLNDIEAKITSHITTKLTDIESSVSHQLSTLASTMTKSSSQLTTINNHMSKITEELSDIKSAGSGGESPAEAAAIGSIESCSTLVDQVGNLLNGSHLSQEYLNQQESRWQEMQSVIASVKDVPSFLPRDCSDYHYAHPESPSGVYDIYPTMDRKSSVSVWCEMADKGEKSDGGWTVILRRQESDYGHISFNRTWKEYARGFGNAAEGEWWFSLSALHALTYRAPYTVKIMMRDIEDGYFDAVYTHFRVDDESRQFKLSVDGFSGTVPHDAFQSKHHGRPFTTPDVDNDALSTGNCAISNQGGWWFNACHYCTLTAPFPVSKDREARTIRWRVMDKWLVLDDVTMMIRPVNYGARFDTHKGE